MTGEKVFAETILREISAFGQARFLLSLFYEKSQLLAGLSSSTIQNSPIWRAQRKGLNLIDKHFSVNSVKI